MTVSELCQACGLCCRGALFRYASLLPEEATRLEQHGIRPYTRRDGRAAMHLPCSGLSGTRCGLYEARPRACDAYFCQVVFKLRAGKLTADEALEVVREAQARFQRLVEALPPKQPDDPESELERAHLHGLVEGPAPLRSVEAFLQEHFL